MLLVLGVDSEFCNVEALVTGIVDNWPDQLLKHRRKFTVALCALLFCLGIPLVTNVSLIENLDFLLLDLHLHKQRNTVY
jgi:solute carrier family 6 GABA transporter-like protein 1